MKRLASYIINDVTFNRELAKYLWKELRKNDIDTKKNGLVLYVILNDDDYLHIDCLEGKVYLIEDDNEKYFCNLGQFKNKKHLGEAYNCAMFNVDKLIKKIEALREIKEKNEQFIRESEL
jgi:hypothetical protein